MCPMLCDSLCFARQHWYHPCYIFTCRTCGHVCADRKVFEAKRSASSVTGESKAVEALVEGRHITVVDTPGTIASLPVC